MKKYSPLEFTSYAIWAGTLMLLLFSGGLVEAVRFAPNGATAMVVYLGLFPAAVGYVLWAHVLAVWPASKAATALFLRDRCACGAGPRSGDTIVKQSWLNNVRWDDE